ncbi:MAG: hypothetical protein WBC44_05840 [Planctomycetaceae bacterium]
MSLYVEDRIILDLCGGTGGWSAPYRDAGYDVRIIDPYADTGDVRLLENPGEVWGILCAPPCTHLTVSGARWWASKGDAALLEALSVVDACLRIVHVSRPQWWALENPVGRLMRFLGPPAFTFDPCDFGDPYTKRTCLWGSFRRPRKSRVDPIRVCSQGSWIQKLGGKSERTKRLRSVTPAGFAKAFYEVNR